MKRLFRQFSFRWHTESHAAETLGSTNENEGSELGYSLAHAYGAAACGSMRPSSACGW